MKIDLDITLRELLTTRASKIYIETGEIYYYFPYWFKSIIYVPEADIEVITFDKLPEEVKEQIKIKRDALDRGSKIK